MNLARLADVLLERPLSAQCGAHTYTLYPPSLGVSILAEGELARVGFAPHHEATIEEQAILLAEEQPQALARYIAYHLCRSRAEAQATDLIDHRANSLLSALSREELVSLALFILEGQEIEPLLHELGIDQDIEAKAQALKERGADGWASFGGQSLYGALIDPLAERYGWTMDYILWGISYANLRLLLSDQRTSLYMGERGATINADDPRNAERIEALLADV